jgi:hypothetical protein
MDRCETVGQGERGGSKGIADLDVVEERSAVGGITMQNVIANLSRTPGRVRHPGRPFGADTQKVLDRLQQKAGEGKS